MKVTVDVDADEPRPGGDLLEAARAEAAVAGAVAGRGVAVAVGAAVLVALSAATTALWLDELSGDERWILRSVFALALALLVAAAAAGLAAGWPRVTAAQDVAAVAGDNGRQVLYALVDRAHAETVRRSARLRAAIVLLVLGLTALAGHAVAFAYLTA